MSSRLREPFGKAGLIVAIVALVAATVGGAYAASSSKRHHKKKSNSTALIKKESKKWSKKFSKQFAKPGPAGPQGPAGDNGAKGDNGANGSNGSDGATGPEGPQGPKGDTGEKGEKGDKGDEGSPWTAGGTLPPGATETGKWSMVGSYVSGAPVAMGSISYPIHLAEPSENAVHLDEAETIASAGSPVEGCEYEVANPEAVPVAPPGTLCVFTDQEEFGTFTTIGPGNSGDTPSGTSLWVETTEAEPLIGFSNMFGTWAVTAAEE